MLGVQMYELAFIAKSVWQVGQMAACMMGASDAPPPEVDMATLIRQTQTLRV